MNTGFHSLFRSILERRPGLGFTSQLRTIHCQDCGAEVHTVSRNCIRCKACAKAKQRADLAAKDARRRAAR